MIVRSVSGNTSSVYILTIVRHIAADIYIGVYRSITLSKDLHRTATTIDGRMVSRLLSDSLRMSDLWPNWARFRSSGDNFRDFLNVIFQ